MMNDVAVFIEIYNCDLIKLINHVHTNTFETNHFDDIYPVYSCMSSAEIIVQYMILEWKLTYIRVNYIIK